MAPPDPDPSVDSGSSQNQSKRRRLLLHDAGKQPAASHSGNDNNGNDNGGLGLALAEGFGTSELRLLEATPEVLAALCCDGQEDNNHVRVVGCEEGAPAALVTREATFELCRVETSNMLLLVPPLPAGAARGEAVGHAAFHYELKRSKPKVEALKRLLASQEPGEKGKAWSLAELEQVAQGSQAEVRALLKGMAVLEVAPGQWRAVEEAAVNPTLDRLLNELLAANVPLSAVKESVCRTLMPDVDPLLLSYCLRAYGNLNEQPQQQQGQGHGLFSPASHPQASFALDVAKIARFKAHQIFRQGLTSRPQGPVWERGSFLLEWEASLPSTHRPDAAWLQGVCLEEKGVGGEACLRYLPAEAMPLEPGERVKRLFEARKRWRLEEMAPYMRGLFLDDKAMGDWLTKHTRAALGPNGERVYSAK